MINRIEQPFGQIAIESSACSRSLSHRTRKMSATNDASANEVLKIYRAAAKTSLKEHQDAFDGAVGVYRTRNQDASEKVARRAVERIICNSL
jgi:hypothetical protein